MSNYYSSHSNYYWKWETEGAPNKDGTYVLTVKHIGTLIYKEPLLKLLESLAPLGLPQIGSIVLILVAASERTKINDYNDLKFQLSASLEAYKFGGSYIQNVLTIMDYVHNLPKDLRTGDNLTYLLEVLFEKTHNKHGIKRSKQIITEHYKIGHAFYGQNTNEVIKSLYEKDTRALGLMVRRFKSMQDLIKALTHVPTLPVQKFEEVEELLPVASTFQHKENSLVESLQTHPETIEIGSLIKRIWSGLNIPMHHNAASSQPLGGVSDITNKGDVNRLLVSEFAYDKDTFLSRIANNEALYLERETANEENDNRRVFLIDCSIKNWGIPKILSFATALAIATHPKSSYEYTAYLIGDKLHPVNFNDILELISGQQVLSAQLDPTVALEYFFKNNYTCKDEVFLFTTAQTLESNNLQYAISQYTERLEYVITTNAIGHIDFYRLQNRSRKHLKQIQVPIQEIWAGQKPIAKAVQFNNKANFSVTDHMLTPILRSEVRYIACQDDFYVVQSGHLFKFTPEGGEKGLQLLHMNVVNHKDSAVAITIGSKKSLNFHEYNPFAKAYYTTNLSTGKKAASRKYAKSLESSCELFTFGNRVVACSDDTLYYIDHKKLEKVGESLHFSLTAVKNKLDLERIAFKTKPIKRQLNFDVIKKLDDVRVVHFYGDVILQFNKLFLNTKTPVLEMRNNEYHFIEKEKKNVLSPIVNLYLKRLGSSHQVKYLQEYLGIDHAAAVEMSHNTPCIIKKATSMITAQQLKEKLELKGLTCYIESHSFKTDKGASIYSVDGKIYFKTLINDALDFCMVAIIKQPVAFSSEIHFTGNRYFLPQESHLENISYQEFRDMYIIPFFKS